MRRRQLLLLFVCANAQFALPTLALAKDGEDDDSNHDSDDDSDDDDGSDDNGGDDDGGGDGSSGNGRDDDRDDHDRAYEAVSSGQAVPLRQVLDSFAKEFGGTVVDVKLVAGDTLRYRIRFVDGAGRVRQIYYDATNGKLLR